MRHIDTPFSLSVVLVCFQSAGVLGRCLRFIRDSGDLSIKKIIVVNNSADDAEEISALSSEYGAEHLQCVTNLGYGAACNAGFDRTDSDCVVFLNPDVMISAGSLKALAEELRVAPGVVAVGPAIFDGVRKRNIKLISSAEPNRRVKATFQKRQSTYPVQYIPGCAIAVRSSAFRQIGGFDDGFFLYFEDDDISIRLGQVGELRRVEIAVALHRHGGSTPNHGKLRMQLGWHLGFSMVRAMRKHRGKVGKLLAASCLLTRMLEPLNLLSARHRRKTYGYVKGGKHALFGDIPEAPRTFDMLPGLYRSDIKITADYAAARSYRSDPSTDHKRTLSPGRSAKS